MENSRAFDQTRKRRRGSHEKKEAHEHMEHGSRGESSHGELHVEK